MTWKPLRIVAILVLFLSSAVADASAATKLLRFPDIHGEEVVFSYGGDLWKAPAVGGIAVRLTAHPGQELFAQFSPDGKWIAFTGQYDGDEQVYVMPATGGQPKRLTWYPASGPLPPRWGYDNQVYGWTRDGTAVLFRSTRDADGGRTENALYTVSAEGGLPVRLPMPTSGAGDFSPDGKRMVYSPLFRDFRTWKRYEGGWAQDLYIFDLNTHETEKIAASPRTERDPMWIGSKIYFVSDRDGTLNLFSYDPATGSTEQLTESTTWDVRWPGTDHESRIVYESDGELHVLDLGVGSDTALSITVPDDGLALRPSRVGVEKNIEDFALSPKGERVVMIARGDLFTLPIEKGPTRNLTNSSGSHEKWGRWSPDGTTIAYVSDRSGEDQVYLVPQDGSGDARQLTDSFAAMLFAPEWSPDGKRLAVSDKDGRLYVLRVEDGKVDEVADERNGFLQDYSWSPDGAHLAFSLSEANDFRSLHIWSADGGTVRRITDGFTDDHSPVWDPEGDLLFFLSDREFAPQISTIEWNYAGNRQTGIFALALRRDVESPFAPESDEVTLSDEKKDDGKAEKKEKAKKKDDGEAPEPKPVKIDFEGLAERLVRVPVSAENYAGLAVKKGFLLYASFGAPFYGRESYAKPTLKIFDMEKREDSVLVKDVTGFALSRDGSKVLVRQGSGFHLYDVKPEAKDKKTISTRDLYVDRVPKDEWLQIFDEVWRRYRDFFYVENLHGYDWRAIGDRYRALVPHVAHRSDLNYVIGEMIAELNVGHAYIEGGDFEIPERAKVGLPGARFALDEKAGRYRISKIFPGDNAESKYRAPLTEVGVDVGEGDFVLAIDGEELTGADNPYRLLQYKTDPVTLTVNGKPSMEGARSVTYTPIADEGDLLYLEWVRGNRARVDEATGGRAGYLHIPNMGASGIYEFLKAFYPQIRKEGLVIDVRSNGGGNVSQWILERLDSKVMGTRFGRLREDPLTYPYSAYGGHLVCLLNSTSASDGDIFPHYFREYGLGPLIGKRSWGGVVGISGTGPLIDGGTVYVPLQGTNNREGEWVIEGRGVDPDIEVENDPKSVLEGRDPQLERGIAELMKKIEADPRKMPSRPADPVKTR